jgi:hypothetical protein
MRVEILGPQLTLKKKKKVQKGSLQDQTGN